MKPFAVSYREPSGKKKLSALRFAKSAEAREYALRLIDHGATACAVVKLGKNRLIVSYRGVVGKGKPS